MGLITFIIPALILYDKHKEQAINLNFHNLKKILLIINPASGRKRNQDSLSAVKKILEKSDWKFSIYQTTGNNDPEDIQKEIDAFKPERVAVSGGDGTVNMAASLLMETGIPLAVLPGGSANGLAKNLEIPENASEALHIALSGKVREMDVIASSEGRICLHLCDAGLNARIVKRFEKQESRGLIGYGKQMIRELFSGRSTFHFTATINQKTIDKRAEMVLITNMKKFGTGAMISPQSLIDDGIFEFLVIKPYTWKIILDYFHLLTTSKRDRMNFFEMYRGNELTITFNRETDLQMDGEILEKVSQISFYIKKKALKVLVPANY